MNEYIEFYDNDRLVVSVESIMVPTIGSMISIRGMTWKVMRVTYALDHSEEPQYKAMRANVEMSKVLEENT